METYRGAKGRAARVALVALALLALLALLGFAVEPSTSTQFDVLEGRGVAVVQAAHQLLTGSHLADRQPDPEPAVPVVLSLLAVGLSTLALVRRAHDAGGRLPSSLGRASLPHRGPPAR